MSDDLSLPSIDAALVKALDKRFPERSPTRDESYEALIYRGGQRAVVRFLIEQLSRQENTVQETHLTNVYHP